ncbi:MAG: acetate kinase, partial [Burkholderiales bacterium PBB5]
MLAARAPQGLLAVAHRIVHGGPHHHTACLLDDAVLADLATLNPLAPLHQPHNLDGVAVLRRALPGVPQVGCFDTAFHATLWPVEQALPLPAAVCAPLGLRRFGFHGLSYQYLAQVLTACEPRFASGRALLAHLGNGASVCGTLAGQSVASSMGFSALDGLMMGTRSGALDPGVLLLLLAQGWAAARLEQQLY